jgi:hypothetical protein
MPAAQELGEGGSGQAIGRDSDEEGEHGLALADVDVLRLLDGADVPTERSPLVLLRLTLYQEQREPERLRQRHKLKLRRGQSASVTFPRSRARRKRMYAEP